MKRPARILLLGNDPLLRTAFEHAASVRVDIEVEAVASVDEARARAASFDLVVCDVGLGPCPTSEMLVCELVQDGMRVVVVTSDVPAVATSALGSIAPIVAKPVTIDELLAEWPELA